MATWVEYMCTTCGRKQVKGVKSGRPMPGTCPRKTGNRPHSWVKNRTW
jgi:hypothetical protein